MENAKLKVEKWLKEKPHIQVTGDDLEYLIRVVWVAQLLEKDDELFRTLELAAFPTFFGRPATTVFMKDFAQLSFYFIVKGRDAEYNAPALMNGGVIFHWNHGDGKHPILDGSWSVHT